MRLDGGGWSEEMGLDVCDGVLDEILERNCG